MVHMHHVYYHISWGQKQVSRDGFGQLTYNARQCSKPSLLLPLVGKYPEDA